jgi:hypothetical protein
LLLIVSLFFSCHYSKSFTPIIEQSICYGIIANVVTWGNVIQSFVLKEQGFLNIARWEPDIFCKGEGFILRPFTCVKNWSSFHFFPDIFCLNIYPKAECMRCFSILLLRQASCSFSPSSPIPSAVLLFFSSSDWFLSLLLVFLGCSCRFLHRIK